ncbi:hypothetical protein [Pedobacter heparinus]|uniref:hypothetical protein n=1 Tax=Pedobacter heparinus TaxID=984 RepID=UPI00292EA403|nr:hypothetical protein [Pedobacter heparinus]
MKPVYILCVLQLFYLALFFAGCSLFKKTTITSNKESKSSSKQLEANMLILKNANKETQVFTYWTDSGFYQFQHIKEQTDLAKSGQLKAKEKVSEQTKIVTKQTQPLKFWIYIVLAVIMVGYYLGYRKL